MDEVMAKRMEDQLVGTELNGWTLHERLGIGKSAIVFRGTRGEQEAAVKVFDQELVKKFGPEAQRARGEREKKMIGKRHPNVIEIFDAGYEEQRNLFFTTMAILKGKDLNEVLADVPPDREHELFVQIVEGAQFLEQSGFAHRDIKPANIVITEDFRRAVIIDLGVVRPLEGYSSVTDHGEQKQFVGTLQYAPPELLFRIEEDTVEAWRAITFYQLGAVLHDLLVRRPLFADVSSPYARLVQAVSQDVVRNIDAPTKPIELRLLAQECLTKTPANRLAWVNWDRLLKPLPATNDREAARARIEARRRVAPPAANPAAMSARDAQRRLAGRVGTMLRETSEDADAPPLVLGKSDAPEAFRLRAAYKPSESRAVNAHYAVYVDCTVTDVAAQGIRVLGGAAIAASADALPDSPEPAWMHVVFEGVEDDQALRERIDALVLHALDRAGDACAASVVTDTATDLAPAKGNV